MAGKNVEQTINRVAVFGCGNFSPANLYALASGGVVDELILAGTDAEEMAAVVREWQESYPTSRAARIIVGDERVASAAAIVVIAETAERTDKESDLDCLKRTADIVRTIARRLSEHDFAGVIVVATNPVDIMAEAAFEESNLPAGNIIGSGRLLETRRFRDMLDAGLESVVEMESEAEAGEPATWCAAQTVELPVVDFCQPNCPDFDTMLEVLRKTPAGLSPTRTSPPAGGGSCINRICHAVLRDERVVLPVCARVSGRMGVSGVFLTLPSVIGRHGIQAIIDPKMDETESRIVKQAADVLTRTYRAMVGSALSAGKT